MSNDDTVLNETIPLSKVDGRRARGLRRREAILKAASHLFITKGYRKTTLSDIIKEAGGSRETIYSMFNGKVGLFGALIARWGDESAEFVLEPSSQATPPREFLIDLGLRLMKIWLSPHGKEIHRTVLSEGASSPELVRGWYEGGSEKVLGALSKYIDGQVKLGRLNVEDSLVFARQFQFLLFGEIASPAITGEDTFVDAQKAVERTVNLLLRATEISTK